MKLIDVIGNVVDAPDQETVLCVKRPWKPDAECIIVPVYEDDQYKVPSHIQEQGYEYFLEVFVVEEVLETPDVKVLSQEDKARVLIYYAENDAYPEWL